MNTSSVQGMIGALAAAGPHSKWAEKLNLFGQFVGEWDVSIVYYPPEGGERRMEGEWLFGWALEGRAIQDVWIAHRRSLRTTTLEEAPSEYGTTVRFYDPMIDAWRSTWIGPVRGVVMPFIGRQVGNEIVLEGSFEPGVSTRWIFSAIAAQSFHWRAEESRDEWKTRRLQQEMNARRRA